jgi:hypothetical protein
MEPGIWLKDYGEHYEHISIHVDDLLIASKYPQSVIDTLINNHHFKLKGTVPMSHHLGCDFGRDEDGTLHFAPRKRIEKTEECYQSMFGSKLKQVYMSPLEKGDHPELDFSKYPDQDEIQKHQSLVGSTQ